MWFIGGSRDAAVRSRALVVLGQEPLQTGHFDAQLEFATADCGQYETWQLDYFAHFSSNGGDPPQAYWRTMHSFIAGFRGDSVHAEFEWNRLGVSYMELPLVPLHSPCHVQGAFAGAATELRELLLERLKLVARHAAPESPPVFFAAGSAVADALACLATGTETSLQMPPDTRANRSLYGNRFYEPIRKCSVAVGGDQSITIWTRRAPFAQGWQRRVEACTNSERFSRAHHRPPNKALQLTTAVARLWLALAFAVERQAVGQKRKGVRRRPDRSGARAGTLRQRTSLGC